jgi:hypothetical protein
VQPIKTTEVLGPGQEAYDTITGYRWIGDGYKTIAELDPVIPETFEGVVVSEIKYFAGDSLFVNSPLVITNGVPSVNFNFLAGMYLSFANDFGWDRIGVTCHCITDVGNDEEDTAIVVKIESTAFDYTETETDTITEPDVIIPSQLDLATFDVDLFELDTTAFDVTTVDTITIKLTRPGTNPADTLENFDIFVYAVTLYNAT